jgi:hypothetical protein
MSLRNVLMLYRSLHSSSDIARTPQIYHLFDINGFLTVIAATARRSVILLG